MNKKKICVLCGIVLLNGGLLINTNRIKNELNNQSQIIQKMKTDNSKLHKNNEKLIKDKNKLTDDMKTLQNNLENTEDKLENTEKQLYDKNEEIKQLYIKPTYCP